MLIAQTIPHLLNGVSQRPGTATHPTQLASSVNAHGMLTTGLMKRPAADYLGKLTATTGGWSTAFAHAINRDDDDRFLVTIRSGTLQVWDMSANGVELTVTDKSATYLTGSADGYAAVTVGNDTIVVNRSKTCTKSTVKSAAQTPFALVTVEQSHFSTLYKIKMGSTTVASYRTPAQSTAQAAELASTDNIAENLRIAFASHFNSGEYTAVRYGSTLYITQFQNKPFDLTVEDGLSDQGLYLIVGEAQSFEDLPTRAPDGLKVKVIGDFREDKDDYWVEFDASEAGDEIGIWRETIAPKTLTTIKGSTNPHRLVWNGSEISGIQTVSALPKEPAIVDGFTAETEEVDRDEIDTVLDKYGDKLIETDESGVYASLTTADSSLAIIRYQYDIDTGKVPYGVDTIVQLWKKSDYDVGNPVTNPPLAEKAYTPGATFLGENIGAKRNWAVSDEALLILAYGTGASPGADNRATLTILGESTGTLTKRYDPLRRESNLQKELRYASASYPEGCQISVRLDDTNTYTHTATAGGQTYTAVATALAALINAGPYTASASAGVISIQVTATGDRPDVTWTNTVMPDTIAYVSDAAWTPNALAGLTVKNHSDGSEATVSSNTAVTLTATLTGGQDNSFQIGDRISVTGTTNSFVFEPIPWEERDAGDDVTNPFPSFIDEKITEVFFWRNRLGFTSGSNVILSESGEKYNFFRTSVFDLLDGDIIDIESAHAEIAVWHSAVPLDKRLFLWSENGQYELSGEPFLSPRTVRLDLVSRYFNSNSVRPVVIGRNIHFTHQQSGNTRVFMWVPPTDEVPQGRAREITEEVPTYIDGAPVDIVGDGGSGFLSVLSDGDQTNLYVFNWKDESYAGWGQWSFDADMTIVQTDFIDSKLLLIAVQTDGVYLYQIDLDISNAPPASEKWDYLDQGFSASGGDLTLNVADTDVTTPYDIGVGKTLTCVDTATGTVYSAARVDATTAKITGVDLTLATLACGRLYEMRVRLSPIWAQGRDGNPERLGRLQLRQMEVQYQDSTDFQIEVTPTGRSAYTKSISVASPRDGSARVPVLTRAEDAQIEIVQDSPGGCRIVAVDWEGYFKRHARKV